MRRSNLSRLFVILVSDIYKTFKTTTLNVGIIALVIPKFTDKKIETQQNQMTWLTNKIKNLNSGLISHLMFHI